uniref:Vomeronasal type-1 receptor n=1 Tax=Spermophilus dauricus TaxID=99837 RepID=A0A8C9NYA3_SPEDA
PENVLMDLYRHINIIFGAFLISQLCIGVLGNSLLFLLYAYTFLVKPHLKKHIDPIVMHLMLANALTIMFTLIPDIASTFGVRQFLNEVGCQTVLFLYRVTRGVSICTTSLLSAFQAITVGPSNSKWAWLKFKLPTYTCPLFLSFWVLNMLIYFHVIESITAIGNFTMDGYGYAHAYCRNRNFGKHNSSSFFIPLLVRDLVFVFLMICTSLYMVSLLYRHHRRAQHVRSSHVSSQTSHEHKATRTILLHHRRAQHVHSPRVSSQTSPEHKATHTILLLVGCFVFFYFSNNCFSLYSYNARYKIPRSEGISGALSSSYPTICPFLLMKNNRMVSQKPALQSILSKTLHEEEMKNNNQNHQ